MYVYPNKSKDTRKWLSAVLFKHEKSIPK